MQCTLHELSSEAAKSHFKTNDILKKLKNLKKTIQSVEHDLIKHVLPIAPNHEINSLAALTFQVVWKFS